jgi:Bacterial self-protective colicin-like immunity
VSVLLPDVSCYVALLDRYLAEELAAEPFADAYMTLAKRDKRVLGEPVGPVINETFLACDEYVDDPLLRTGGPFEIDGDELRRVVACARETLRELGAG